MRRVLRWTVSTILIIGLAWAGLTIGSSLKARSWVVYRSGDNKFAADFPAEPTELAEPALPPFKGDLHTITAGTEDSVYQVAYIDLPPDLPLPEAALMAMTASKIGGNLIILSKDVFRLDQQDGGTTQCKISRAENRIYRLSVSHSPRYRERKDIDYFFANFDSRP
jgi:hypothetical protein